MRLTNARITEFQSVLDSNDFSIGDITCLVGKNEAGKTALLKALYRLNPIVDTDTTFDPTHDYPRQDVVAYKRDVQADRRNPARVVHATYALDADEIAAIKSTFGPKCLKSEAPTVILSKDYENTYTIDGLEISEPDVVKHIITLANIDQSIPLNLQDPIQPESALELLTHAEQTDEIERATDLLQNILDKGYMRTVYDDILNERLPKFLYFDEYYQMKGQENLDALQRRQEANALDDPDYPLLGLIELAGLDLSELLNPDQTQDLISQLEAAGNHLTQSVLPYWSQNKHLRMTFDIRPALANDPPGLNRGTNIWGRVEDTKHRVSTALGSRSRGFVWFFSFLAWYSQIRSRRENVILLLDEPGLSLHAKAQEDLLRYFEDELRPNHQLLYTTHSPFMVDPTHFDRVRIVQDLSIDEDSDALLPDQRGTKVITEVLEATPDSLFPLQGALGYEIHQTLFIGPNSLVVEGASDLLYIQAMSSILKIRGKAGLSDEWVVTPVGGSTNVATFVALVGANTNLNVAVLIDYKKSDQQAIERFYKNKLLKKKSVLTYADFTESSEADIEDMFDADLYLQIVNGEYQSSIVIDDLPEHGRIVRRIDASFDCDSRPDNIGFNHYRPARYFCENANSLQNDLSEATLCRFQRAFDALNRLL